MKKKIDITIKCLVIITALLLCCCSCVEKGTTENSDNNQTPPITENDNLQDNNTDENEDDESIDQNKDEIISEDRDSEKKDDEFTENKDEDTLFESKLLSSAPSLNLNYNTVLVNNIPVSLDPFLAGIDLFDPIDQEQILDFKCGRFVFMKDGSIIDIKKKDAEDRMIEDIKQNYEEDEWDYFLSQSEEITESFINDLNKTVGIRDIRQDRFRGVYDVFCANGKVFSLKSKYATKYTEVENPVLNMDGTLNCPQFPEAEEWTDIVDYRMCDNFILALTSDGKLLSLGTDFDHENIKMFDIFNFVDLGKRNGDFPVAVTKDGQMIFGNLPEGIVTDENIDKVEAAIEIAKTFTDVEDFVFQWGSKGPVIIVRKTDGTLLATENEGLFNPEYINVP